MAQSRVMEQSSHASGEPMIREGFDRDGWARVQGFLTGREIEALRRATDDLARKGADLTADAEIDGARYEVQTASGRRGERAIALPARCERSRLRRLPVRKSLFSATTGGS
jgi:hypothetical protein